MQLRAEQLAAHLGGPLRPIYTIHGDEPLLAQEAADAVRAAARAAGHVERVVFTVSGAHFDWSALLGQAQSQSLFAAQRLIEIRIPSGKPGTQGSQALQKYCNALAEGVLTIVQLPRLDRQQTGSAWFTALESAGAAIRIEPVPREQLPAWLAQRLSHNDQRVVGGEEGQRTLAFFADRVEGNLLAAHQELQKLALLHPPGELSFEAVESAVLNVARYDVFKLSEAVLAGQVKRTLRMLDGLRSEGESPVLVHWTLSEDIRNLHRARAAVAQGQPLPLVLRELRLWGVKERLVEQALPRLSDAGAAALLQAASICDGLIKGLKHPRWPLDPWEGLRRLAWMMLSELSRTRRSA
jgi:DNA polymerase III subunit delta